MEKRVMGSALGKDNISKRIFRVLTFDLGFTEPTGICLAHREGSRQADKGAKAQWCSSIH